MYQDKPERSKPLCVILRLKINEHRPNPCPSLRVKMKYIQFCLKGKENRLKVEHKFVPPPSINAVMIVTVISRLPTTKVYTLHSINLQYEQ